MTPLTALSAALGAVQWAGRAVWALVDWRKGSRLKKAGRDEAKVEYLEESHAKTVAANLARFDAGNEPDPDKLRDEYFRD